MSYTNETTFYGLPLPTGSDKSTFTDNNTAFQAVDAALHTAYEQSGAATEDIVAIKATVANLIQADIDFQNDLDTEKGKIRNLQDKEVLQDAAIAAVKADSQDMITAYNEPTATSTHAYSVGDFFIYNDVLYQATQSIAIGDTIVPDTNCTTTNVSSELLEVEYKSITKTGNGTTDTLTSLLNSLYADINSFGDLSGDSYLEIAGNIYTYKARSTGVYIFTRVQITNASIVGDTIEVRSSASENYRAIVTSADVTFSTRGTTTPTSVKLYFKLA